MKTDNKEFIPTPDHCREILKEAGCSDQVICHCEAVRDVALRIVKRTKADKNLVEAGALLHDIGRSKTHGIDHGFVGACIARKLGLSERIVSIIETHIGAGLTASVARSFGLPDKDFIPKTLEEKIVCHADNLVDDYSRQDIEFEVERALQENNKNYALQLVKLHKEISDLIGMDANKV
ncbi:MAG: HDIG domain-containing protein [Candidatus Thermoplasmatota archaeon]|nr:HDIG domain-containing protein [Candidatus Thermoplasmatota archaeon]